MNGLRLTVAFLPSVLLAAALRFPRLADRPMHCDEGVNADKFGSLLEGRGYRYDPSDYHGPTLYYLTLLPAWLQRSTAYVAIDEVTLRSVPAAFGVTLVAAHVLLVPNLGTGASAAAALLAALSPAMVFYSRYYIHETLLVSFGFGTLIAVARYLRRPAAAWAILAGAFMGLMHATKETAPIAIGAVAAGFAVTLGVERWWGGEKGTPPGRLRRRDMVAVLVTALVVSVVWFSAFFGDIRGVVDSVRAYGLYAARTGTESWHAHPWYYYLGLLLRFPAEGTPLWTEGLIVGLATIGLVAGWRAGGAAGTDTRTTRFLGVYTLVMIVVYSAIPYKTPWCLLGFLHGMILLAGIGVVAVWRLSRRAVLRLPLAALLGAGAVHLGWQAWAGSFRFSADPRNPYVYAHTLDDVRLIAGRIEGVARAGPEGRGTPVDIISRANLWPLPWYLRRLTATRWWDGVSERAPSAPVILVSPEMEPALIRKLYDLPPPGERELHMSLFDRPVELRPRVELRGYAAKTLWDRFRRLEAERLAPAGPGSPK